MTIKDELDALHLRAANGDRSALLDLSNHMLAYSIERGVMTLGEAATLAEPFARLAAAGGDVGGRMQLLGILWMRAGHHRDLGNHERASWYLREVVDVSLPLVDEPRCPEIVGTLLLAALNMLADEGDEWAANTLLQAADALGPRASALAAMVIAGDLSSVEPSITGGF